MRLEDLGSKRGCSKATCPGSWPAGKDTLRPEGGESLPRGAGGLAGRNGLLPLRAQLGAFFTGSQRPGPRCLLSETQAAPEAGADHWPRVQQQLRAADPERRAHLSPETVSRPGGVSGLGPGLSPRSGGTGPRHPQHSPGPFISALLWALHGEGVTGPSPPPQQQQYPHPPPALLPSLVITPCYLCPNHLFI